MLLNRDDWYETSRDLDWTLSYVQPDAAFPASWSGAADIPPDAWQAWEEPFRVSYRDHVRIQWEKETGVKAVSSALARSGSYEKLDPAHVAASHLHMVTTCFVENMAVTMQSRFYRFAPSPKWRNLGVFAMLDETRHTQLDTQFSHDLLKHDPRFDWTQKAFTPTSGACSPSRTSSTTSCSTPTASRHPWPPASPSSTGSPISSSWRSPRTRWRPATSTGPTWGC